MSPAKLGVRVKKLRQERALSQEDIAAPDYTAAYISHIEHGKRRASQEVLSHIAGKLGMTLEQLVSGRDPEEDLRLEIATQKAVAAIHLGEAEAALADLESLQVKAKRVGNESVLEEVENATGLALYRLGRIDAAVGAFDRALSLAVDASPERRTTAIVGKARCLFHAEEVRQSIHILETHLAELQRQEEPDPGCLVDVYAAMIPGYFETGMLREAQEAAARGWELAPRTPDAARRGCLYVNRAQLLVTQGHHRDALASLALAADLYHHLGWYAESVKVAFARSFSLTERGEWDEAEALILETLDTTGSTLNMADQVHLLIRLATIKRNQGDHEAAATHAREALKKAGSDFLGSSAEAERELGSALMALGDEDAGVSRWRKSLAKFLDVGNAGEAKKTAGLLGDHLLKMGEVEEAAKVFRAGLSLSEEGS